MKVVICGAGQVGYGIAERLARERNDVAIIDTSPALIRSVSDTLDVQGFVGHGAHPDVLARAGVGDADMLIAVTLHDEVNMIACQIAHSMFKVPTKIARVRAQSYLSPEWSDLFSSKNLAIDVVISPEIEVGEMVLRRLALPGSIDTANFLDDGAMAFAVTCEADCPIVDTPLRQLDDLFPELDAVIVGIVRGERTFVPGSDDHLLIGDIAYVVARMDQVERALSIFGHEEQPASRVVLAGGGNIGLYVAREFEARRPRSRIKLIESSRERAVAVSEDLARAVVLHGSALDQEILEEAGIADADTIVALTNNDEVNVLSCVMGKRLGAKRSLVLLNNASYPTVIRSLGIDAYVNPRLTTVSRVLQHVRRGRIRQVHSLLDGAAEVIEAEALDTSPLVGKPLRELDVLDGMRIGAILRGGKVMVPRGETLIRARDRVVVFALADKVRKVEQLFRVSIEFF